MIHDKAFLIQSRRKQRQAGWTTGLNTDIGPKTKREHCITIRIVDLVDIFHLTLWKDRIQGRIQTIIFTIILFNPTKLTNYLTKSFLLLKIILQLRQYFSKPVKNNNGSGSQFLSRKICIHSLASVPLAHFTCTLVLRVYY